MASTIEDQLDEILADTTEQTTLIDSISTVISGLKTQIDELLANESLSGPARDKLNQIFAQVEQNRQRLAEAVTANTPAEGGDGTTNAGTTTV